MSDRTLTFLVTRAKARLRRYRLAQTVYRRLNWHLRLQFARSPWSVALETSGSCNRKCSYCPVSLNERSGEMPRDLFEKVIDDLARIGFKRTLSFHFYNEPLLDKRLPDLVAYARKRLPDSVLDIFTNGDYLTPAWIKSLLDAGIKVIRVSLHSPNSERHVRKVLEEVDERSRGKVVWQSYWDREATGGFLYNRIEMSESLPQIAPRVARGTGCSLVNSLAINYEGETALCCNDFFADNGHGNVAELSVGDLWRRSRPVRKRIYLGYFEKEICQACNVSSYLGRTLEKS